MIYDEQPARRIQALGDTPEMGDQRRRVLEQLAPQPGWRALDVGCGPGHLAAELADAVGPTGHVCGADVSRHMLAIAGDTGLELVHLDGPVLPFANGVFDAAVATQVYEFVEEPAPALSELHRVLRPGGRAVILDTDWSSLVWHSGDPMRMDRVIEGWRRRVVHPYLPRTLGRLLREAGFETLPCETFTILDTRGDERSYSARQIDHLGSSAVDVDAAEVAAWAADLRELARAGDYFFCLNRYLFLAVKPAH